VARLDLNNCEEIARWVSEWADQQRRTLA